MYERTLAEDDDPEHVPADLVHHFLLAICTRPGVGICFRDRGWYPRELDVDKLAAERQQEENIDDDGSQKRNGRLHNRMLANVLKGLKANEDPRQQELALKIMAACPELVAGWVIHFQIFTRQNAYVTPATGQRYR